MLQHRRRAAAKDRERRDQRMAQYVRDSRHATGERGRASQRAALARRVTPDWCAGAPRPESSTTGEVADW